MTDRWYCVQTNPRQERAARGWIGEQGFEVFLPEYLREDRKAVGGKVRRSRIPTVLFPNYLFVRFDRDDKRGLWRNINVTRGVVRLLATMEGAPIPVPTALVDELLNSVDGGYLQVTDETKPIRYRKGQYLRVVDGALEGFVGLYVGSDRQRVGILLEIMGAVREVFIPELSVQLADKPQAPKSPQTRHPFRRPRHVAKPVRPRRVA